MVQILSLLESASSTCFVPSKQSDISDILDDCASLSAPLTSLGPCTDALEELLVFLEGTIEDLHTLELAAGSLSSKKAVSGFENSPNLQVEEVKSACLSSACKTSPDFSAFLKLMEAVNRDFRFGIPMDEVLQLAQGSIEEISMQSACFWENEKEQEMLADAEAFLKDCVAGYQQKGIVCIYEEAETLKLARSMLMEGISKRFE